MDILKHQKHNMKKDTVGSSSDDSPIGPLRFAHPFFTTVPPDERPAVPGAGNRMTDYIATQLQPIPVPQRDPTMQLADVIGAAGVAGIQSHGSISFHAVGDTWNMINTPQQQVAAAMTADYNIAMADSSPAFFLHLGDVDYYNNTDAGYHEQFYVPYKNYPGKIIALPGNHDGELFKYDGTSTGQTVTLQAFWKNFCQPKPGVPPAAGTIYREMPSLPGAYWLLQCPFVDIIGLYSNMAENPGFISDNGVVGQKQKDWLVQVLAIIQQARSNGTRKALILAMHHPPFSNGGHGPSTQMLADMDDACTKSGIMPDAVLSGHAHNYQRYTRYLTFNNKNLQIPFLVAGTGGRGSDTVAKATGKRTGDNSFDKSMAGYGYLKLTASAKSLLVNFYQVLSKSTLFDTVTVDLAANTVK